MITESVCLKICTVEEAPNYNEEPNKDFKPVKIENVIIVKNGMMSGKPSFDIHMVDADGNKYLAFVKGGIMEMILAATT